MKHADAAHDNSHGDNELADNTSPPPWLQPERFEKIASRAVLRDRDLGRAARRSRIRAAVAVVGATALALWLLPTGQQRAEGTAEAAAPQAEIQFAQPDPLTLVVDQPDGDAPSR